MKVFLVVPPEQHFIEAYNTKKLQKGREFRQKLGLLSVAGYLRGALGIEPKLLDCLAEGWGPDEFAAVAEREQPDIVGFSALTFNLLDCLAAAEIIKRVAPKAKICFGGFHPTLYPKESLALPLVDYVVSGEGEITFAELVRCHLAGPPTASALAAVDGLGFLHDGKPVFNKARDPIAKLDDLPLPAHDLLDLDKYTFVLAADSKVGAIQTSRGCPSKCTFCDMRLTKHRYRSEDHVLGEIKLLAGLGVSEFFAVDDTFTINRNRVKRLCAMLREESTKIKFKISARCDRVDEELLADLASAGCYRIHFGVESGSQRILDRLQKGVTIAQIEKAFAMARQVGIQTFAYMMIGTPTETRADMEASFALVKRIAPDHVNYSICTPFPKTFLYEDLLAQGSVREDYWQAFAEEPTPSFHVRTAHEVYSEEELRKFQDQALRRFYASPRIVLKELRNTKSIKQLALKAKIGLRLLTPW